MISLKFCKKSGLSRYHFVTWIYQNSIDFIALIISIIAFISIRRGISSRAKAEALKEVEGELSELNVTLETEVKKLQKGLDDCVKERIGSKEKFASIMKALKVANIEIEELNARTD